MDEAFLAGHCTMPLGRRIGPGYLEGYFEIPYFVAEKLREHGVRGAQPTAGFELRPG
ncbi:MAG: hypothetical protein HKO05_10645 [Erythrobacter sp.]|nr:hypothetical protein [Erythrobacter sp.]